MEAKEKIFIDGAESQGIIHWLGIPYLIESSFRGRFWNVLTLDEETIDFDLEGKIIYKYFTFKTPK